MTIVNLAILWCLFYSGALSHAARHFRWYQAVGVFALYTAIVGMFSDDRQALFLPLALFLYSSFAAGIAALEPSRSTVIRYLLTFTISSAISCSLSLVDKVTPIDIPRFNEGTRWIHDLEDGISMKDMSGPFNRRSPFGAMLTLVLPTALCLSLVPSLHRAQRSLLVLCSFVFVVCAVYVSSRSVFLSLGVGLLYFVYNAADGKAMQRVALCAMVVGGGVVVVSAFNRDLTEVFYYRLGSIRASSVRKSDADMLRIRALKEVMFNQYLTQPLGSGFGYIDVPGYGRVDAHNSYIEFLYAGGPVGTLIIMPFVLFVGGHLARRSRDPLVVAVNSSLVVIGIHMCTHSHWPFDMLWAYVGVAAGSQYAMRREALRKYVQLPRVGLGALAGR